MTRIFEVANGHLYVRRANGDVVLDTSRPMPAVLGDRIVDNVDLEFDASTYETLDAELDGGGVEYRTRWFEVNRTTRVDLGSAPDDATILWGSCRLNRTTDPVTGIRYQQPALLGGNEWFSIAGTVVLESIIYTPAPSFIGWRTLTVEIRSGRFEAVLRHTMQTHTSDWDPFVSNAPRCSTEYSADFRLAYGRFVGD